MRRFRSCKGQRHHVGRWWTATTGAFVGYESWLERDRLVLLDFDRSTVGIASQPFWLFWTTAEGKVRSHVLDYFARLISTVDVPGHRDRVRCWLTRHPGPSWDGRPWFPGG